MVSAHIVDGGRLQWVWKLEFLFTSFGYAIGLGNLWRFPFRCYESGGGSFLIPYIITTVFCTFPMLALEMFLGQFSSEGPVTLWRFCPLFKGVGWSIVFVCFMINVYYIVAVTYAFYYMVVAFVNIGSERLPWQRCDTSPLGWNTELCRSTPYPDLNGLSDRDKISAYMATTEYGVMDATCVADMKSRLRINDLYSLTFNGFMANFSMCEKQFEFPEKEYLDRFVLEVHGSPDLNDLGGVVGRNALCLFFLWAFVFYCCLRGIRSIAKVSN